jgi:hypothetical protein
VRQRLQLVLRQVLRLRVGLLQLLSLLLMLYVLGGLRRWPQSPVLRQLLPCGLVLWPLSLVWQVMLRLSRQLTLRLLW